MKPFLLLALTLVCSALAARNAAPAPAPTRNRVMTTSDAAPGRNLAQFVDRKVSGANDRELGVVEDMLVDAHTGAIAYAAVGNGNGELRLVPFAALREADAGGFTVSVSEEQWKKLPVHWWPNIELGRWTLSEAESRELSDRFALTKASARTVAQPRSGTHLIRVRELAGKRVTTGGENIGTIAEVVLGDDQISALAVIAADREFAAAGRKFLVPLGDLNLAATQRNPIETRLTRADFEQARKR